MASYDEMVSVLSELLRAGRTGTLYITTGDNHSGTFGLDKGKIVSLGYNRLKGPEALPAIREIKEVRHRFSPLGTGPMEGCPTTDEILRFLRFLDAPAAPAKGAPAPAAKPSAPPAPAKPAPPAPANTPRPAAQPAPAGNAKPAAPQPLNAPAPKPAPGAPKPGTAQSVPGQRLPVAQVKAAIVQEATEYLGPMAPHVCEEHFVRTPPLSPASLLKVVDAIAAEVEPSHRDRFRMRVLHHVELLLA